MRQFTSRPRARAAGWIVAALVSGSISSAAATPAPKPVAGQAALDEAFRFASAIEVDPKDRARAQSVVIGDYLTLGAVDRAAAQAGSLHGWRRGTAYADIASHYAREGETVRAREWIEQAEQLRRTVKGWEGPRIAAQVALALAQSGDLDRARQIAAGLVEADSRQYAGLPTAVEAIALAARDDFDAGLEALDAAEEATDFEFTWWRTRGYLELARRPSLDSDRRLRAIEAARASSDGVAGWRRIETLTELSHELFGLDRRESARTLLESADALVLPLAAERSGRAPLMAMLGQAWARLGESGRASARLREAIAAIDDTLEIDQPGILASVAAGYALLGDHEQADAGFDAALDAAGSLTNARPRALALVAICRQLGLAERPVDSARGDRLQALFEGLRAPW